MIAGVIAESDIGTKFRILGIPDKFFAMAHAQYLYKKFSLDTDGIENEIRSLLN